MGKKQNNPDNLITEFLVRLLDKETAELLDAAMKTGKWKNRNALVNECIKGYLLYQQQIANPEATVKELFEKYMSKLDWKIKKQLDNLKNLLLIISTTQLYDDKPVAGRNGEVWKLRRSAGKIGKGQASGNGRITARRRLSVPAKKGFLNYGNA